jgi:hypothetical protein
MPGCGRHDGPCVTSVDPPPSHAWTAHPRLKSRQLLALPACTSSRPIDRADVAGLVRFAARRAKQDAPLRRDVADRTPVRRGANLYTRTLERHSGMRSARERTSELTYMMVMEAEPRMLLMPRPLRIRGIFGRLFRRACGATPAAYRSAFLLLEAVDFVPDRLMGSRVASHHPGNDGGAV